MQFNLQTPVPSPINPLSVPNPAPAIVMIRTNTTHEQIMEALTMGVRFLSLSQIARAWFDADEAQASLCVKALVSEQLVSLSQHLVHPEFDAVGPEFEWTPGEQSGVPDFKPVAYRLRKRWSEQKEMTELVFPELRACERFGGTMVRPRPSEISHDLHFGAVYLTVRERLAVTDDLSWVSGDTLRSHNKTAQFAGSVPDAVLTNAQGEVQLVVEGAGKYSRAKLESIHRDYSHTSYQLW